MVHGIVEISVVIPVINEEANVARAIGRAWNSGADEVIVIDGGSSDGTRKIVQNADCRCVHSDPGRGIQQNAGAKVARGDVILFLHADTWLEPGSCSQIRDLHHRGSVFCGAFNQSIESPEKIYRWIERGNAARVRWRGLFYGDQGIFVSRSLLESIGGFPEDPLMEDFILARKLKKYPRSLLPGPIHVDARRWKKSGPLRQTVRNWSIVTLFYLGVGPKRLAKLYRRHDLS